MRSGPGRGGSQVGLGRHSEALILQDGGAGGGPLSHLSSELDSGGGGGRRVCVNQRSFARSRCGLPRVDNSIGGKQCSFA
jgi:hypothetical protein